MGDYALAEPLYQESLAIREKVLGKDHPGYAAGLNNLAVLYTSMGDYALAEPLLQEALAIREKVQGKDHPGYATVLNNLGGLYNDIGDNARAEPLYQESLAIREKVLGKDHPSYATSLSNLGLIYNDMGDYARAEPLYQESLTIREKVLGKDHPSYATSLSNLGLIYNEMGDYARAEPLYQESLTIREKVLGKDHPDYATSLSNLGSLYTSMGDYARAEPLLQESLAIREKVLGKGHPRYATGLNNLGGLYNEMGDYARAEPLYQESLAINLKVLGKGHPRYAIGLNNLGGLYNEMGDYARAEPLYQEALAIREKVLGKDHPDYAVSLNNLGLLYTDMGDYALAEPLYQESLAIREKVLGKDHPGYAAGLNNLAGLYNEMGDYARAEPLYQEALAFREKVLGKDHPRYAASLSNLGLLYNAMGDDARALPLFQEAVTISLAHLEQTAYVQFEAQQLVFGEEQRFYLDRYLSLATRHTTNIDAVYQALWSSKGSVLVRQQAARRMLASDDPELQDLAFQLHRTADELATQSRNVPDDPKQLETWRDNLTKLTDQRESLERRLSLQSAEYRRGLLLARDEAQAVVARFPPNTILVDLLEYWHVQPVANEPGKSQFERRYVAFVSSPGAEVKLIELGSAELLNRAVQTGQEVHWNPVAGENSESPSAALRRLVWEPLRPYLEGVATVLISPDSQLAMVPWNALPGDEPGTFLIEQYAIAVVPVPQMVAGLFDPENEAPWPGDPGLLLVGNVDFDNQSDVPLEELIGARLVTNDALVTRSRPLSAAGGSSVAFERLPGSKRELDAIASYYEQRFSGRRPTPLEEDRATLAAFCRLAPMHRYLHLATHGFFAEPTIVSAAAPPIDPGRTMFGRDISSERQQTVGWNPGVLSGLVFAGANQPFDPLRDEPSILTALDVSDLDLRGVELAVLSACETSQGRMAGGEGVLGLQRAFQVAGARTTVTSLWGVDDTATEILITEFYKNLWGDFETANDVPAAPNSQPRISPLEALRQAQLTMLREYDPATGTIRGRGIKTIDDDIPLTVNGRLHPYFWAAFVLSGEWR